MSSIFASLPLNAYRKVQGSVFICPLDPNTLEPIGRLTSLGSVSAELDIKTEYTDLRENQSPRRDRIYSRAVQTDASIKLGYNQFTGVALSSLYQAQVGGLVTQTAASSSSKTFTTVNNMDVLELVDANGKNQFDVTIATITDGTTALPAGSYRVDRFTGLIQILTAPVSGTVTVTYTAAAITADSNQALYSILSQPEFIARVVGRQNNLDGANMWHVFPKVQMRTPQSIKIVGNDNSYQMSEVECPILYDSRFPGNEYGWANIIL